MKRLLSTKISSSKDQIKSTIKPFLSAVLFIFLQRMFNWPLVDLTSVRNWQNYSDFQTALSTGTYSFSKWTSIKGTDVPYGDLVWLLAKTLISMHINSYVLITLIQVSFIYYLLRILEGLKMPYTISLVLIYTCPPIAFALQRANIDLLIFMLILLSWKNRGKTVVSLLCVTVATLMKFYPLFLILMLAPRLKNRKRKLFFLLYFALISLDCLREIKQISTPFQGSVQSGLPVVGYYLAVLLQRLNSNAYWFAPLGWYFLGIVFFLICFLVIKILKFLHVFEYFFLPTRSLSEKQIFFLVVSASCFFSGLSFDYRLIYLVPLFIPATSYGSKNQIPTYVWNTLLIIALYLCCAIWVPLQFFGDLSLYLFFTWVTFDIFYARNELFLAVKKHLSIKL